MNRKSLFLLLCCMLAIASLSANPIETSTQNFRIQSIIGQESPGNYLVSLNAGSLLGLQANSQGKAMGLWTEEEPDRARELGTAAMRALKEYSAEVLITLSPENADQEIRAGDLVSLEVELPERSYQGVLFQLALLDVGILDINEEPLVNSGILIWEGEGFVEEDMLQIMVEDVRFVGVEMRKQMEDPMVEEGPYGGKSLFTVMEACEAEDLLDFFSYVNVRPAKYQGYEWKLSEIFATWVIAGAPKPVSQLDLMLQEIQEEIDAQRSDRVTDADLFFDLKAGTLNGIGPTASPSEVKAAFPFFTGETEEGQDFNCGGGVFFLKHDFYFYTHRDYLEVRSDFAGTCSIELFNNNKAEVEQKLGKPDKVLEIEEDGSAFYYLYKMKYGTLVITFSTSSEKVTELAAFARKLKDIEICW